MKKLLFPLLLAALLLLTACTPGENNPAHPVTGPTAPTGSTVAPETTAPVQTTDPGTEPPASETTAPQESTAATEAPTEPPATEPAETLPEGMTFPYVFADGRLELDSLFQYSGLNPDCGMENGDNVGALVLKNLSDTCLEKLDLSLSLYDGTVLTFEASQLPAGGELWAFEKNNTTFDRDTPCTGVSADAVFHESGLLGSSVTARPEGMQVTLTNESGETLRGVTLFCHPLLDDVLFGGVPFSYEAGDIQPGGSTDVLCVDCFLGEATPCWVTAE